MPPIALHHQLVGANDELQSIIVVELLCNILSECVTCASGRNAPALTLVRVRPHQIANWPYKDISLVQWEKDNESAVIIFYAPSWGISCNRSSVRMWSRESMEGDRPPCGQNTECSIRAARGKKSNKSVKYLQTKSNQSTNINNLLKCEYARVLTSKHWQCHICEDTRHKIHTPERKSNRQMKSTFQSALSRHAPVWSVYFHGCPEESWFALDTAPKVINKDHRMSPRNAWMSTFKQITSVTVSTE